MNNYTTHTVPSQPLLNSNSMTISPPGEISTIALSPTQKFNDTLVRRSRAKPILERRSNRRINLLTSPFCSEVNLVKDELDSENE